MKKYVSKENKSPKKLTKRKSSDNQMTIEQFFGLNQTIKRKKEILNDLEIDLTCDTLKSEEAVILSSASSTTEKSSVPSKVASIFLKKKTVIKKHIESPIKQRLSERSGVTEQRRRDILSDFKVEALVNFPTAPDVSGSVKKYDCSNCGIPFSHTVPGTDFVVDYFTPNDNYQSVFLSHFHYDHYKGLTNSFMKKIYCSEDTARLVLSSYPKFDKKNEPQVIGLPMEKWSIVNGVPVLLMEAFHCPGAVCFIFRTEPSKYCFHSGDFRAGQFVERYAQAITKIHLNTAFIDTTYCNDKYDFPTQSKILDTTMDICIRENIVEDPRCLVVVGSYTIGKESVFAAIARLISSQVCVASQKLKHIKCFQGKGKEEEEEIQCHGARLLSHCELTTNPQHSRVHVLPMGKINWKNLPGYLESHKHRFDRLVAFSPTGWSNAAKTTQKDEIKPRKVKPNILIYDVPYSEHSAYSELKEFVEKCLKKPCNVYSSVFSNYDDRRRIESQLRQWLK